MVKIKNIIRTDSAGFKPLFPAGFKKSLKQLEESVDEVSEASRVCMGDSCKELEPLVDELHEEVFSLSEPRFCSKAVSYKIKELKEKIIGVHNCLNEKTH